MLHELLLMAERLVVAMEHMSRDVRSISVSLDSINDRLFSLVKENRNSALPTVQSETLPGTGGTSDPLVLAPSAEPYTLHGDSSPASAGYEGASRTVSTAGSVETLIKHEPTDFPEELHMSLESPSAEMSSTAGLEEVSSRQDGVSEDAEYVLLQIPDANMPYISEIIGEVSIAKDAMQVVEVMRKEKELPIQYSICSGTDTEGSGKGELYDGITTSCVETSGGAQCQNEMVKLRDMQMSLETREDCERVGEVKGSSEIEGVPRGRTEILSSPFEEDSLHAMGDVEEDGGRELNSKESEQDVPAAVSFECAQCKRKFERKLYLAKHLRVHSQERPYCCDSCGLTFKRGADLKMHVRVHSGERPHKCSTCEKAFAQLSSLLIHRRTHSGEKPYKCEDCGKTFSDNSNLMRHMKSHACVKPFECAACGKALSKKNLLLQHIRTHTGERPYACASCGSSFTVSSHLSRHMRLKHSAVTSAVVPQTL